MLGRRSAESFGTRERFGEIGVQRKRVKYSGKYVKIYFNMKITFVTIHFLNT